MEYYYLLIKLIVLSCLNLIVVHIFTRPRPMHFRKSDYFLGCLVSMARVLPSGLISNTEISDFNLKYGETIV